MRIIFLIIQKSYEISEHWPELSLRVTNENSSADRLSRANAFVWVRSPQARVLCTREHDQEGEHRNSLVHRHWHFLVWRCAINTRTAWHFASGSPQKFSSSVHHGSFYASIEGLSWKLGWSFEYHATLRKPVSFYAALCLIRQNEMVGLKH